jgi:hypothetical protein
MDAVMVDLFHKSHLDQNPAVKGLVQSSVTL